MSEEVKSESEKKKEDWMNSKWRPMMGWMYMVVCTFDMIVFPILWSLLQTITSTPITQWNPLTLQGAGLFHIAMGAVLGIAAFGRTQEKLNGANNGGAAPVAATPVVSAAPAFSAPKPPSFNPAPFSAAPAPVATAAPVMTTPGMPAAMGKPMPSRPPLDEDFPPMD